MADKITTTSTRTYGSKIGSSIKGIVVGFLMFIFSFYLLYTNEGTVDKGEIAEKSVVITDSSDLSSQVGKLVSYNGTLVSDGNLGDEYLKPGDYIKLERKVEVYGWIQDSTSTTKQNLGGSETTETTYTYSKDRTSYVQNSSNFYESVGHTNIDKSIEDKSFKSDNFKIGKFSLNDNISLPYGSDLSLNEEMLNNIDGTYLIGNYIYVPFNKNISFDNNNVSNEAGSGDTENSDVSEEEGSGDAENMATGAVESGENEVSNGEINIFGTTKVDYSKIVSNPQIGDQRISYRVLKNSLNNVTVFGKLENENLITSYIDGKGTTLYLAHSGTRDEAIESLHNAYKTSIWIMRLIGFFLMWIGLNMIFSPIPTILSFVPFIGKIGGGAISIVTFVIALILTIVTILISMILHNIIALIVFILVLVGLFVYLYNKRSKKVND